MANNGELLTEAELFKRLVGAGVAAGLSRTDARRVARDLIRDYDLIVVDPFTGEVRINVGGDSIGGDDGEKGR